MQALDNIDDVFLELVRAGLWEKDARIASYSNVDWAVVYRLAREQAVIGLIAAGMERVIDVKVPRQFALTVAGEVLQLEQRNKAMNAFVAQLIDNLRKEGIFALIVKGQGIAQCYEQPLLRACGDVDIFLNEENYHKALKYFTPLSSSIGEADKDKQHVPLTIGGWEVELHGTLRSGLWKRVDNQLDEVQRDAFCGRRVRSWMNGQTQVFMPGEGEDVVFVFVHILQHFFKEGIGLRQICDWCRLLWTYREKINKGTLENRLKRMKLMSEWLAFASLVVEYLGMPTDAMPFYSDDNKWSQKARKIMTIVLESGNFGQNHNHDFLKEKRVFVRKAKTLKYLTMNNLRILTIFPKDTINAWIYMFFTRMRLAIRIMK